MRRDTGMIPADSHGSPAREAKARVGEARRLDPWRPQHMESMR